MRILSETATILLTALVLYLKADKGFLPIGKSTLLVATSFKLG